jgi:hypothetical protein
MKHITNFEEFGYHSDIEEDKDQKKYAEKFADDEFLNAEIQKSKKRGDASEIEKERCYKCKKPGKPEYVPSLSAIPRLMG